MLTNILPATNLLLIITISIVAIHNFVYLNKHRKNKSKLIDEVPDIYPLVKPEFYNKPLAQQTVENNHEIHEINKKLETIEKRLEELEKAGKKWNNK